MGEVVGGEALLEAVGRVGGLGLVRLGAHAGVEQQHLERALGRASEALAGEVPHGAERGQVASNALRDPLRVPDGREVLQGSCDLGPSVKVPAGK